MVKDKMQTVRLLVGFILRLFLCVAPAICEGQYTTNGTLYTIQSTGPVSNRLNIVIFSEGYITNNLASHFLSDATNAMNNLFYWEPYQEYQNYCNVYAIAVPSINRGSTHPLTTTTNNTFFGSSYDPYYDYVITVPTAGLTKMTNLLSSLMPSAGLPIILVNDNTDGGAGGPVDVVSTGSSLQIDIIPHETGHTLGKLQDEYDYGYPYSDLSLNITVAAANTCYITNTITNTAWSTSATNSYKYLTNVTWGAWITNGTPIATTNTAQYGGTVGLFQGANYTTVSWYRPQEDCMMRTLGSPFCSVCAEALVKAICQKARPVDSYSPPTNSTLSITNTTPVVFTLTQPQPLTHNLNTQWYTNGVAVGGATNKTFTLNPGQFTNGNYTLQAQVHDPTPLVRTDPSNYLSATLTWNLALNVYKLNLDNLGLPKASSLFHFRVSGNAPYGFVIQGATNLVPTNAVNWYPLSTNFLTNGQFYFTNKVTNLTRQFYRVRILP